MTLNFSLVRDHLLSAFAWPVKKGFRQAVGEHFYQQCRASMLRHQGGLGLDWRWCNSLRTVHPLRRDFGWQSGQPIDRYYTEDVFLTRYADDIRGHVLEIGDRNYTIRFGGANVLKSDVLHMQAGNKDATIVADLTSAEHIPSNTFDCAIFTFTLHLVYDVRAALRTLVRILKPGGVLLIAAPGISQIARYDDDNWGDYWRFTSRSLQRLFAECFPAESVTVQAYGNVLAATASLHGLLTSEVTREELDHRDRDYEVVVTVRAVKS